MPQAEDTVAVATGVARGSRPLLAQQPLRDPEREPLLADAGLSHQERRLWEPAGGEGASQPVQQGAVTVDRP